MERLAVVESDPTTLSRVVERAALYTADREGYREMFVRVSPDRIETPASAPGASQASYCTLAGQTFEELAVPVGTSVDAMFDVTTLLGWLDWMDDERVTVRFEGQGTITSRLVLEGTEATVEIDCEDDPAVLTPIETFLPDRFDGTTFLDEEGNPLPTRIETTATTLARLVRAVEVGTDEDRYPITVRDGVFRLEIAGEAGAVETPLPAEVSGPAVTNEYGEGFLRVVNGIEGPVTLQTGPGTSVAFVQESDCYTLRFVVAHD